MEYNEVEDLFKTLKSGDEVLIYPNNRVNPIKATFIVHANLSSYWNKYIFEINERTSAFETQEEKWFYSSDQDNFREKTFGNNTDNQRRILIRKIKEIKIIKKLEDKK